MFTLRKWLSTEAKPRSIIIFEGWTFAPVNNHFLRVNILTIILSGMYYLFYYTEITVKQETLRECCWWGRCGFLGETKSFAKTAQNWFPIVRLNLIKKTSTHTWWFHMHFNAKKYVFQCRHCNRTSDRFEPYAHQCCVFDSRNYRREIVRIFTLRPMEVLHGKFMWGIIISVLAHDMQYYLNVYTVYYLLKRR